MVAPRNTVLNGTGSHFLPLFPTRCHYRHGSTGGQRPRQKKFVCRQGLSDDPSGVAGGVRGPVNQRLTSRISCDLLGRGVLWSFLITKRESADKPGSVVGNHSSGMHVAVHLKRPTRKRARAARCDLRRMLPYLALLQAGFAVPSPLPSTRCALTAPFHPCRRACARLGGLLSVALSVGSRPPGVTWRRTLWSPDFPPFSCENGGCLADSRHQHSGNGHAPQAESPRFAGLSSSARA